jgi:hypothetical protein
VKLIDLHGSSISHDTAKRGGIACRALAGYAKL